MMQTQVVVIGGGAAGMMAALSARQAGASVTLLEPNEKLGVPLKTERGGRVFPCSDKAADVIDALFFALKKEKVAIRRAKAQGLEITDGKVTGVRIEDEVVPAGAVIIATGGVSYVGTGSTGDGYRFAQEAGHKIVAPRASLVPLVEEGDTVAVDEAVAVLEAE